MKKGKLKFSGFIKFTKISGLLIGVFIAILFLSPYLFKDSINQGVEKLAGNYIKTEVKFKDLNVSFFKSFPKLTVTLDEVEIKGTEPFANENLLSAKEFTLGIDLKSLFGNQIVFNKLSINQANIVMKVDSLGKNNFDILKPTEETKKDDNSSSNLVLTGIDIDSSSFIYDDQSNKTYIQFSGFNYDGGIDYANDALRLDADATIDKVSYLSNKENFINNLALKGKLNTTIDFKSLTFSFNQTHLTLDQFQFILDGTMRLSEFEKDFDIKLQSENNDLKYLPQVIPLAYQDWAKDIEMKGYSDLLLTLKGIMNEKENKNPDLHLGINIKEGFLNYKKSETPIQHLNLVSEIDIPVLDPNKLRVVVKDLTFDLLDGKTKTALIFLAGNQMYSEGDISSTIDLEALKNATGFKKIEGKGVLNLNGNWKGALAYNEQKKLERIPTFDLKGTLSNGYLKLEQMPQALDEISFNIELLNKDGILKNTSANVHHISIKALQNYVEGNFKVNDFKTFPVNADFKAKVRLQDIYSIYPLQGIDVKGELFANLKMNGVYDPKHKRIPRADIVLKVANGYLKLHEYPNLPIEDVKIETHLKSKNGTYKDFAIDVLPIQFTLSGKPFMVRANLKDFNSLDYKISSKGELNLAKIYELFPIDGLDLSGLIVTNFGVQGKDGKSLTDIKNRGFVKIENIKINTKYFPHKFLIKDGVFRFNGQDLVFKDVKARYKRNNFVFDGQFSEYMNFAFNDNSILKGRINFTSDKVNIDDFMAFNSVNSTSSSAVNDGVVLLPKNMNLALTGNVKNIHYRNLNLQNFVGELDLNKGVLTLKETHFDMIGSQFSMSGNYRPINARNAKFKMNAKAKEFDIQRAYKEIQLFRDLASAAEYTYGKVSMDYNLEGYLGADMFPRLKTIKGGGIFVLEDIKFKGFKLFNSVSEKTSVDALYNAKFNQVKVTSLINDNVITIDRTKFKVSGFRLRLEGQVTLDGYMNLGMRLGLPPFGIIGIPITVNGPSDQFKIQIGRYEEEDLDESDEDSPESESQN